ncbi:MAG: tetraacyldisaccharide 4'-kinase [Magnetococcales bacterium]|nr:tetraacyldisaccharide 4'-kinase [Magnetococcales bacterium]
MAWTPDLVALLEGSRPAMTQREQLLLRALRPFGWCYGSLQALRAHGYARRWRAAFRPPRPVISVGNITSGGTGKTPLVLWLAQEILGLGYRPAIVSRGYGQESATPITVVADPDGVRARPPLVADEPFLLANRLPGVAVLTGPERALLIRAALERYPIDIILMDDAFQHLQVARDLDLLLLDARQPWGNGHLLPAGVLREFPAAVRRCDGLILTRANQANAPEVVEQQLTQLAPGKPILRAHHHPECWVRVGTGETLPLAALSTPRVQPFCALARPDAFRATLDGLGMHTQPLAIFPDHHPFQPSDLARLVHRATRGGAEILVCTEKDAVKINAAWSEMPLFYLRMAFHFPTNPDWLRARLRTLLACDTNPCLHAQSRVDPNQTGRKTKSPPGA